MFDQFKQKHFIAKLPTSVQSYNYLVDNVYRLEGEKYLQFASGSEQIDKYLRYFLKNIKQISTHYDFTKYYGSKIDHQLLINNLEFNAHDLLFNRLDFVFEDKQIKLLEININRPTTFSEQVYDQLKTNHNNLDYSVNSYFNQYQQPINIGFVVENRESDAVSSYFILKQMISNPMVNLILIENKNILIQDEQVFAFDQSTKLDQIIYYVPFEANQYKSQFEQLVKLQIAGKLKLLSSPLSIFVQSKGFLALTTKLLADDYLPSEFAKIVSNYFLETHIVEPNTMDYILENKDQYVFKPSYGRTSNGVFIGKAFNQEQIYQFLNECFELDDMYIVQQLVEIEVYQLPKETFGLTTYELTYPIFGSFLVGSNYVQTISRLSKRFITNDGSWTLPIIPFDKMKVETKRLSDSLQLTNDQKKDFILNNQFCGFGLGTTEYLTNQALLLDEQVIDEMNYIAETYTQLLIKTQKYIINNSERYSHLYRWNSDYMQVTSDIYTIISRVDIIINEANQLKVLESNVETPAGLLESFELEAKLLNNQELSNSKIEVIKQTLIKRLSEIDEYGEVIALITLDYYEDMYNIIPLKTLLEKIVVEQKIEVKVEIITIQNLKINDGNLETYDGRKIKVLYRYFPLDWFNDYPYYKETLNAIEELFLNNNLVSLTPNETIISQHKTINAIIHQLTKTKKIYSLDEQRFIKKYIPFTAINGDHFFKYNDKKKPYITKSTLGREGSGIYVNAQYEREVVFQEMENVELVKFMTVSSNGHETELKGFPVYGIYVSDTKNCGIYTRISDQITNKRAYYLPIINKNRV